MAAQQSLPLFAEIVKIDDEQHMVFGYASTDRRDLQGETIVKSAMEAALPDYMLFANIREMHQPSAVGLAKEAFPDDKGLWLGAWVGDDRAWAKVKSGIYKGFSIGGRVTSRDPDDRSIITGLELSEISLVDRPANPDALFQIIKRVDGQLRPEPLQIWYCGIHEHQHLSKSDAGSCMAHELLKRCHDEVEHGDATTKITIDGPVDHDLIAKAVAKALNKYAPNLANGRFGSYGAKADEHKSIADDHATHASAARAAEQKHRALAAKARDKGDASSVNIHDHLAGASAALAAHHDSVAEKHRELAARYGAVSPARKSAEELDMPRTVAEALKDSTSAVALLQSSIKDNDVNKGGVDHAAEAKTASGLIATHETMAGEFEKAANDARTEAAKHAAKRETAEADTLKLKSQDADLGAVHHHGLAKGYANLVLHHVAIGGLAKEVGDMGTASLVKPEDLEKSAAAHEAIAKRAKEAKDAAGEKHHTEMAEAYRKIAKGEPSTDEGKKPDTEQDDAGEKPGKDRDGNPGDADDVRNTKSEKSDAARKCEKCDASVPKGADKCLSCGASMHKDDSVMDAAKAAEAIKGVLDKISDDGTKKVLADIANKLADAKPSANLDETIKASVDEAVKKATASQAEAIAAITTDKDTALVALDQVTLALKGMAKDMEAVRKRMKIQDNIIGTLTKQLRDVEAQPEPVRAKGMLTTVQKREDVGGSDTAHATSIAAQAENYPAGPERGAFLLRHGYAPRAK